MVATVLVVDDSATIRHVIATVLEAKGFETILAGDGRQALQLLSHRQVDVILLDFVMPVMSGYQFCRHLRADAQLTHLPVVLMSAKGDKIRGQFAQQMGAVDAITKPFDPRALVAVIEGALRRRPGEFDPDRPLEAPGPRDLSALQTAKDQTERLERLRAALSSAVSDLVRRQLTQVSDRLDAETLERVLAGALNAQAIDDLGGILDLRADPEQPGNVLSGDLSFVSIPEVMQMLELQQQTGALCIQAGEQEIILYLAEGRINLARGRNLPDSFRIGRFLVEDGLISRESLAPLLDPTDSEQLLGERLIAAAAADETKITAALKRQTSEIVYEAVRWKTGRFTFINKDSCPEANMAQLALPPGSLLMEGFRRVDEWQLIEGSFEFGDVLIGDEHAIDRFGEKQQLTALEELVLSTVDGMRTVRQIVDAVDASTFDVCKILYQFLNAHLVRKRGRVEGS